MEKNKDGEIKCIDEKGNIKWLSEYVVRQTRLMSQYGLSVFETPIKFEPAIITKETETEVAEATPAKRGRKPNN